MGDRISRVESEFLMKYFSLNHAPQELGYVPQDNGMTSVYNFNDPNSIRNAWLRHPVGNLLVPPGLKMRPQAKFTDFLCVQVGHPFLVISPRFLEVIMQFRLPKPEVFAMPVYKKDKKVDYHIFIANLRFPEYIVFNNTEVIRKDHFTSQTKSLYLNSPEEYKKLESEIDYTKEYLTAYNCQLNKDAIQHDLFLVPAPCGLPPRYIVSELFAEAVQKSNLTGIKFEPI
jgi:hypothetical protein